MNPTEISKITEAQFARGYPNPESRATIRDMSSQTFPDLPGWTFTVDEVSANVYKIVGRDGSGRSVEATGTDYDALLKEARRWAAEHMHDVPTRKP